MTRQCDYPRAAPRLHGNVPYSVYSPLYVIDSSDADDATTWPPDTYYYVSKLMSPLLCNGNVRYTEIVPTYTYLLLIPTYATVDTYATILVLTS